MNINHISNLLYLEVINLRTIVRVQRELSGHNLKHPTKWCPPNKSWEAKCQICRKICLIVRHHASP